MPGVWSTGIAWVGAGFHVPVMVLVLVVWFGVLVLVVWFGVVRQVVGSL